MISKQKLAEFHDKNYKKLLIIPALLLLLSLIYIGVFYAQTGDFIDKDVSLTGGTEIELFSSVSVSELEEFLSDKVPDFFITSVSDNSGKQIETIITTQSRLLQTINNCCFNCFFLDGCSSFCYIF